MTQIPDNIRQPDFRNLKVFIFQVRKKSQRYIKKNDDGKEQMITSNKWQLSQRFNIH